GREVLVGKGRGFSAFSAISCGVLFSWIATPSFLGLAMTEQWSFGSLRCLFRFASRPVFACRAVASREGRSHSLGTVQFIQTDDDRLLHVGHAPCKVRERSACKHAGLLEGYSSCRLLPDRTVKPARRS